MEIDIRSILKRLVFQILLCNAWSVPSDQPWWNQQLHRLPSRRKISISQCHHVYGINLKLETSKLTSQGYITKDDAHWKRSTTILDAWGSNLTSIIGTDRSLMIGLDGDLFVNAAEIMRWEGGWVEQGAKWQGGSGFSIQLYWLFARQSVIIGQANYGIVSIKALLSFAVYLDDVAMYNYALYAYKNDLCAGIESTIDSSTGQSSESGRDQSHAMTGLGWLALAARVVNNQGYNLFTYGNNLLLKGSEYSAKYNSNETVPYDPKFYRCEAVLVNGPWSKISTDQRGIQKQVWDILHYSAVANKWEDPWTSKAKAVTDALGGERRVTANDMPSWGDLLFATTGE